MNRLTDNHNFGIWNVLNAKVNSEVFLISVANFNDISKYSPIYSRVLSNVGTYIIMYIAFDLGGKKKQTTGKEKNYIENILNSSIKTHMYLKPFTRKCDFLKI